MLKHGRNSLQALRFEKYFSSSMIKSGATEGFVGDLSRVTGRSAILIRRVCECVVLKLWRLVSTSSLRRSSANPFTTNAAPRSGGTVASAALIMLLIAGGQYAYALEPTPSQTTAGPPPVATEADMPASARIIVKYVDAEAGRVGNEDAARDAARILSEIAGAEIRHLRLMSGNAQVVELVGIQDPHSAQAQQQIESVIQRLEADPAVDYAELDAIMRIQ